LKGGSARGTIVLSWLMAVDHFQKHILNHALPAFNSAVPRHPSYARHSPRITSQDDFAEIKKESHLIDIARSAGIITSDEKKLLDEHLGIRNSAAHPNRAVFSVSKAASFLEMLLENVILRFPI